MFLCQERDLKRIEILTGDDHKMSKVSKNSIPIPYFVYQFYMQIIIIVINSNIITNYHSNSCSTQYTCMHMYSVNTLHVEPYPYHWSTETVLFLCDYTCTCKKEPLICHSTVLDIVLGSLSLSLSLSPGQRQVRLPLQPPEGRQRAKDDCPSQAHPKQRGYWAGPD